MRDHHLRPPLGKLTRIYPQPLLILIMDMWETEPHLVNESMNFCFIMNYKLTMLYLIAPFNEPSSRCLIYVSFIINNKKYVYNFINFNSFFKC